MATNDSGIPGHFPHQLAHWWEHGPGAAQIRWGSPGDFDRCVRLAVADAHMTPERAKGFCNERHHAVLGIYPATHAKLEHGGSKRSDLMAESSRAQMTAQSINDLPDSDFAYIEPGGKKDDSGKTVPRSLRHFPIHDAAHVRNALARAPQSPFGEKAMPAIRKAAKKFGIDVGGDSSSDSGSSRAVAYTRSYGLEDISIRAGDGRTVDAYAAVFDLPTPIRDQDGEYDEIIDRSAFNGAIANAAPAGGRERWRVGVFYNHGRTIWNTPSDLYSMPIGVPLEIRADSRGLFTRTKYLPGPLGDSVIDAIREGSISGYSFSGAFTRSDPSPSGRPFRADRSGNRVTVRRMESTLREYGPTPFPAYADASIVGMRAEQAAMLLSQMPADEFDRFRAMFTAVNQAATQYPDLSTTEGVTEAAPARPATRSPREELQARAAQFIIRHGVKND